MLIGKDGMGLVLILFRLIGGLAGHSQCFISAMTIINLTPPYH